MPRYDDRYGNTRLYVGRLSSRTRARDLEHIFSRYGRVRDVDMKRDYAFVEFSDPRDADDARYYLDGRDVDGSRISVEHARGVPRGSREYVGRGPPPGTGRCFNCGLDGHWARDCKAGDWKNKCYRCGERGHIERNCTNSPKTLSRDKRGRSYSRSPVRSRSPRRGRSRSYSRDRSYSRSRSPVRRERSVERDDRYRSPEADNSPPPSKGRRRSETPDEESPVERGSLSPDEEERPVSNKDDDYADSPTERGRSPASPDREESPEGREYHSPSIAEANGRSESPSPRDASPVDDGYDDPRARKGSESP